MPFPSPMHESEVAQSCQTLSGPMTAAYQAPPSMGFSRQQYWSGVPVSLFKQALNTPSFPFVQVSGEGNGYPLLAWRIPWTEEPGGLQSMRLQSQT